MRGLRALCCRADDQDDDQHTPPNRPIQRLEETTQNAPGYIKNKNSSTDKTQDKLPSRDLWKEAYEKLDSDCKKYVSTDGVSTTDAINRVIEETTSMYEQWIRGGPRIHRKGGDDINVRDSAEEIISAANTAKRVVSEFVSFDPTGYASSAWTVISFGMSLIQNRIDRRDAIFAASVYLAETLAYFALIDKHYRNQNVESDLDVDEALLRVYIAILEYTSEVEKARKENTVARIFRSIPQINEQPLEHLKITVNAQRAAVKDWIVLAANIGDREAAKAHLAKVEEAILIMKRIESRALSAEEERQLEWMSAAAYSVHQRELQKRRTDKTGNWLFDWDKYKEWNLFPGSLLWLHGVSGCGKSVLCSTVIHDIEKACQSDQSISLAYWYFQNNVEETKSVDNMTRSLIRQLSRSPLASSVTKVWKFHSRRGSQPDSEAISEVLRRVLSETPGEVFLIFDALDECSEDAELKERGLLLPILVDLLERYKDKIHILVTSRREQDISSSLEQFPNFDLEAYLAEDVITFVTTSIDDGPLKRHGPEISKLIADRLLNLKERRFRWAKLQLNELEKCKSREDIKDTLSKIPTTLEASYRKVLDGISPRDQLRARDILIILCLSPAVLDSKMVARMVNLDFPESVTEVCTTSLVSEFNGQIKIDHPSVQEFLTNDSPYHWCQFSVGSGHGRLAEMSMDWLLAYTQPLTKEEAIEQHLLTYGAKYWYAHVAASGGIDRLDSDSQAKTTRLFTDSNVYFNWVRVADNFPQHERYEPPLFRASSMGSLQAVNELLSQNTGLDVNIQGGQYGSALQAASYGGHEHIVEMLLRRGADINIKEGWYGSAIQVASYSGRANVVRALLNRDADINIRGGHFGTALQAASYRGHDKIVKMLLDQHADVNIPGGQYGSALQAASYRGHDKIVKMLLDHHADVNIPGGEYGSALQAASYEGHKQIVGMLLDHDADINIEGEGYITALQAAAYNDHEEIISMLIDRGASTKMQERRPVSAYQIETHSGQRKPWKWLLDRDML